MEGEGDAQDGQFEEDEPEAALPQVRGEVREGGPAIPKPEVGGGAGEEHEDGRAEVGDPTGEKEDRGGAAQIIRLEIQGIDMEEIPDVIQGHDHHDESPQGVEGGDS